MNIIDLLPIIIPGILIQLAVQAYYIKHCWENPRLAKRRKAGWIIAIALFSLPGAAAYLLITRDRQDLTNTYDLENRQIDSQVHQAILVLLIITFEVMALRIIAENLTGTYSFWLTVLLGSCFTLFIISGLAARKLNLFFSMLISLLQIALILAAYYLDSGQMTQFLILVVLAGIINDQTRRRGTGLAIGLFIGFMILHIIKLIAEFGTLNSDDAISLLYVNLLIFLLVFAAFYSLKKQLLTNRNLQEAVEIMRQQSLKLEEMSALAERNRIVGEIHDTVGHTLTTSIIAIEAAKNLLSRDNESAAAKLDLAANQVRTGLQDLRDSVRTIKDGLEMPFRGRLDQLLQSIRSSTDLTINEIISIKTKLLPIQQNVLLNAIREFATNSLKHGHSTEIDILLQEHRQKIQLTMSDNGRGTDNFIPGFGLQNIDSQVSGLGGSFQATSDPGEGFTVSILIPAGNDTGDV